MASKISLMLVGDEEIAYPRGKRAIANNRNSFVSIPFPSNFSLTFVKIATNFPFIMANSACLIRSTYGAPTIGDYGHLNPMKIKQTSIPLFSVPDTILCEVAQVQEKSELTCQEMKMV